MDSFGSLFVLPPIVLGIFIAFAGGSILPGFGLEMGNDRIAGIVGIVLMVVGFLRLPSWRIATEVDRAFAYVEA
jgi:hypothetical protein